MTRFAWKDGIDSFSINKMLSIFSLEELKNLCKRKLKFIRSNKKHRML